MCTGFFYSVSLLLFCLADLLALLPGSKAVKKTEESPQNTSSLLPLMSNPEKCRSMHIHTLTLSLLISEFPQLSKGFFEFPSLLFFEVLLKLTSYNISFFQTKFRLNSVKTNRKKFHTCNLRVCVTELVRYLHSVVNTNAKRTALNDGDCPPICWSALADKF